jgi:hypothetical protein
MEAPPPCGEFRAVETPHSVFAALQPKFRFHGRNRLVLLQMIEKNGRPVRARTADLHRVNVSFPMGKPVSMTLVKKLVKASLKAMKDKSE